MTWRRLIADVRRAAGCLLEAGRLARRRPSLLLLPVAVAMFNVVEGHVGGQLMLQRTEYGQWLQEQVGQVPSQPAAGAAGVSVRVKTPSPFAMPYLPLTGTSQLLGALMTGDPRQAAPGGGQVPLVALAVILALLLLIPVNALVRGAYYGLAVEAVRTGGAQAASLTRSAGRFFLRFWLLLAVVGAGHVGAVAALSHVATPAAPLFVVRWLAAVAAFLLMLISVALAWEDTSLLGAIKGGAIAAARDGVAALALFLVGIVSQEALTWAFWWVRSRTWQEPASPVDIPWSNLLTDAGQRCLLAIVSGWLAVALVAWYGEARGRRWEQAAEESTPASPAG